jgi:MFS family permease
MPRALLALLRRNADFRRLFLAAVVSLLGDWFAFVAVSGLVTELTGRPGLAAVVYAASVLPVFAASPIAGVVADRVDRKRMMIAVDVGRIVPALGLLAAAAIGSAALAIACVVTIATMAAFFEPVVAAVTPNLVDDEDLPLAQATMGAVWGTMLFVGAGIGGLVAAAFGREVSFLVDAASFAVSAVLVWRIRKPFRKDALPERATVLAHLGEVWAFVRPRKATRALLVTKTGVGVANGIVGLLPAYALTRFGAGDAGFGLLLAARGLGALVGPFVGNAFTKRAGRVDGRRLLAVCGGAIVTYGLAYLFLPLTASLAAAAVCVFVAHAGGGAQWVLSTYGLQATTPDAVRGRVLSLDFGLATLAVGVSSLVAGAAAEVVGLNATSWALVAVAFVYGAAWLWWTRDLRHAPTDPLASSSAAGTGSDSCEPPAAPRVGAPPTTA